MATRKGPKALTVELVFLHLWDVGRSIDLSKALSLLRAERERADRMGRDTPDYISLPRPLVLDLKAGGATSSIAKVYPDGAVSLVLRSWHRCAPLALHGLQGLPYGETGRPALEFAERSFKDVFSRIEPLVDRRGYPEDAAHKGYTAWCVLDDLGDPEAFLAKHRREMAALLVEGSGDRGLDESQIELTLSHAFSYRAEEIAVFDIDRCLIIDPRADYEDILLVAEHAAYQLLELRQLDLLLDRRLDTAEADMRSVFVKPRTFPSLRSFKSLRRKFAEIQALRLDALFLLENLENSSKIIGDYHLGRIYAHLCDLLNTSGWKWSVERRLETLQSLYELARGDVNDRTMMTLEVIFILVCVFQVFQMFLL